MQTIVGLLQQGFSFVIPFVILLGILIFVHEFGHFFVARLCGVRVEVFSLGFGKKLLKVKRGDTTYALSLIPLGGYVKMFGEQPGDHIKEEDKSVSFTHKNVWQRIAVVIAGPMMNFFFAIFLFFVVSLTGEQARKPLVGDVATSSKAYQLGFRSGDTILQINNSLDVQSWEDLQRYFASNTSQDIPFKILVKHTGSEKTEEITGTATAKANPNILSRFSYIAEVDGLTPNAKGTTVGVPTGSLLYSLGLRSGDTIKSVNGKPVLYWRDLNTALANVKENENISLEILNTHDADDSGKTSTLSLAPQANLKLNSIQGLGLESSDLYLAKVVEKSPAQEAGLKEGDRIFSINDVLINEWDEVTNQIKSYDGQKPVKFIVIREGAKQTLSIIPKMSSQPNPYGGEDKKFTVGIVPFANIADFELTTVKAANVFVAAAKGFTRTWDMSVMTVLSFVRLFENKISPKHIGGVISIGQAASETFKLGFSQFAQMMAVISVNLFILNLLPIPVLDGGHLVFYIIEVFKGAPVSLKKMEIAQQVGLAILMSLMVFALFNDFTRVLGL